jgi:hypothetical protein
MKHFIVLSTLLALVGCTQFATVKEVKPERVGFSGESTILADSLERSLSAVEIALGKLEKNPGDIEARADYNFAVSRIIGTLRDADLKPWTAPIPVGSRTLVWKRDPRSDWNPDKFDFMPTDQLELKGKYAFVST